MTPLTLSPEESHSSHPSPAPSPAPVVMTGKMFTTHIRSLLVKSGSMVFPESNYLHQIVGVMCGDIRDNYVMLYHSLLFEHQIELGMCVGYSRVCLCVCV